MEEEMWHRKAYSEYDQRVPANDMARRTDGARIAGLSEPSIEEGMENRE